MTEPRVLYVDDEEHIRLSAAQTFDLAGIEARCMAGPEEALAVLTPDFDGVLVSDIRMPGMDGEALLRAALAVDPDLPVILLTGFGEVDLAVRSIREGAYDFLEKPCEPARLVACVERGLALRALTLENRRLRAGGGGGDLVEAHLTGRSACMAALRRTVSAIAVTDADVLITGETGVGKERAARALHAASARSQRPFVQINCAALPAALIENELFGHEAGAFAGAIRARYGRLEHARGGTLCLDEIDSLPLPLQAKLLDVLHNRVVTRLGSNEQIPLDIRVLALSKTDLDEAVAVGEFRADLLYRLNVVTLTVPALSDRREDIPGLFALLLAEAAARYGIEPPTTSPAFLSALAGAEWPGNVRELRNAAERHALGLDGPDAAHAMPSTTLADRMAAHEKALVSAAIAASGGHLKGAYEALGLSRKTLYDKMQKHGLSREAFVEDE